MNKFTEDPGFLLPGRLLSGIIPVLFLFLCPCGLSAVGEKYLILGGSATWQGVEKRHNVIETEGFRPYPVLTLSSARERPALTTDLSLSFDEGNPELFASSGASYRIQPGMTAAAGPRLARQGAGAALFSGKSEALNIEASGADALFAPGNPMGSFSLEFWLYPQNLENGEQILGWIAQGQRIQCSAARNRLQWDFQGFFLPPENGKNISPFRLSGLSAVIPKQWSHHLIRYDGNTGLLEYLVNGEVEAIVYTTGNSREGGEVYTPTAGQGGFFTLGKHFSGLIDELIIRGRAPEQVEAGRYRTEGGRIESRVLDLGQKNSSVFNIVALGGHAVSAGRKLQNHYGGAGAFRPVSLSDDSAVRFFVRAGEDPFALRSDPWMPFIPGTVLPSLRGRYVQVAADLYPSGDREGSPYLEKIFLAWFPDEPPRPPAQIACRALDGAVELNWKDSVDRDTAGYLVYFGTSKGEYFGDRDNVKNGGPVSPVDAGNRTTIRIDGLQNGRLYYFTVAAYDAAGLWEALEEDDPPAFFHAGEFSRELSVRPLEGLSARYQAAAEPLAGK
ncbi:MAG: hypothetical protein LBE10_03795 [Treponema sp.]|nr:hypothetical protein [Treponema sp.]